MVVIMKPGFSQEQLETYIAIQHRLNQSFQLDVEESRCLGKKRDLSL